MRVYIVAFGDSIYDVFSDQDYAGEVAKKLQKQHPDVIVQTLPWRVKHPPLNKR